MRNLYEIDSDDRCVARDVKYLVWIFFLKELKTGLFRQRS